MYNLFRQHTFDEKIYSRVVRSDMKLRDYLATDRTKLSNQNTFLAYIRTSLTLFVAGVSFIQFFELLVLEIIGWVFIPIGFVTLFVGLVRYNRLRRSLSAIKPPSGGELDA